MNIPDVRVNIRLLCMTMRELKKDDRAIVLLQVLYQRCEYWKK